MTTSPTEPDRQETDADKLWRFSCQMFEDKEVVHACLALQDEALAARLDAWREALSASIPEEPQG